MRITSLLAIVSSLVVMIMPASAQQNEKPAKGQMRTLGVLLFPGFELLDAFGPMELWGNMKNQVHMVTIAAQRGEITSSQDQRQWPISDLMTLRILT